MPVGRKARQESPWLCAREEANGWRCERVIPRSVLAWPRVLVSLEVLTPVDHDLVRSSRKVGHPNGVYIHSFDFQDLQTIEQVFLRWLVVATAIIDATKLSRF